MTNNKQQTPVEWFAKRIQSDKIFNFEKVLEQAKEMDKAQHGNTWGNALSAITVDKWESFEQYYNETYRGGEQ